jgi:lyso-ornithine lipid O-acyltransferase
MTAIALSSALPKPKVSKLRVTRALATCVSSAIALAPVQYLWMRVRPGSPPRIPRLFHKGLCKGLGIEIGTTGSQSLKPTLFVANHVSWSDIPVLGSQILASFVAKAEVEKMGFVGPMADLQRTIYVERERKSRAAEQRNEISERLLAGDSVILFPEGTSTEGNTVIPFKSSLFSVVDSPDLSHIHIQPITICYTHLNSLPLLRAQRHLVAWIGDMDFGPHAWSFLGLGRVRALIQYHQVVERSAFANRKELARHCEEVISKGLKLANAGRVRPSAGAGATSALG